MYVSATSPWFAITGLKPAFRWLVSRLDRASFNKKRDVVKTVDYHCINEPKDLSSARFLSGDEVGRVV